MDFNQLERALRGKKELGAMMESPEGKRLAEHLLHRL